ncbi:MAG: HIRAN domain-containing protein [Gomphosphaeria aponina SAG 52.96 = DSM 107014]|uniref:HIRAN domain-containing protein n=1 Tax=Gomphosphaeria aponina SAG 52.96 = DSM 107014 TaxID=1521640 RepID=A0A941GUT2_9CHRO|nr:HIRAN domain-containing protein [Gomphosphaeria aponina SAG 52.96 = DSM 107014]
MKTVFLAWQDFNSRRWFPIGKLTYNGIQYQFVYTQGVKNAQKECEFQPLFSFPDLEKVYTSKELFPLFANRVMRRSRPDYKTYLECLNIPQNADEPMAILYRSGGKKATDTFEIFPEPEPDENGLYQLHFFVHGLRYFPDSSLDRVNKLQQNEPLYLVHDAQNHYDPLALLLRTEDNYNVGYCPRYLVDDLHQLIEKNPQKLNLQVERVNPAPTPIQFRLLCNLTAQWDADFQPFSTTDYQPLIN